MIISHGTESKLLRPMSIYTAFVCSLLLGCGPGSPTTMNTQGIIPNYGIPDCHVGMDVNDLKGPWINRTEEGVYFSHTNTTIENRRDGIFVKCIDDKIKFIHFIYQESGYNPFSGFYDGHAISKKSPFEILDAYGQPSIIVQRNNKDAERVTFYFLSSHSAFLFSNKVLITIVIYKPDVDPGVWDSPDRGNVAKYREYKGSTKSQANNGAKTESPEPEKK